MKLEKRVETLEQELQVLKSQIQATLLDIQEQILTNTYPSLKGGDVAPISSGIQAELKRVVDISADAQTSRQNSETAHSMVKQISLNDLVEASNSSLAPKSNLLPFPSPQVMPSPSSFIAQETDWNELAGLETWVLKKISEIGAVRTHELVQLYWKNGHLTLEQRETMVGLVRLYDVTLPEPRRAATANNASAKSAPKSQKKSVNDGVSHSHKLAQQNTVRKTQHTPAAPVQNGAKPKSANQQQARKTSTTTVAKMTEEENQEDVKQNTVLRLIAGINNASAGVIWGKKK